MEESIGLKRVKSLDLYLSPGYPNKIFPCFTHYIRIEQEIKFTSLDAVSVFRVAGISSSHVMQIQFLLQKKRINELEIIIIKR